MACNSIVIFMLAAIVAVLCFMLFFTPTIEGAAQKTPLPSTQYCKLMDPRPSCRNQAAQTKTTVTTGKTVTKSIFAQIKRK